MSERILCEYTGRDRKPRWLDPSTGDAFIAQVGGTRLNSGFKLQADGGWYNGSSTLVPVPTKTTGHTGARIVVPDGNPKSAQGSKKYSLRHLPLPANIEVNRALEDGVAKYGAANWRETGVAASVYIDAALRHINQWYDGQQERANDSGVHNLGHAMACLAIIIDAQVNGKLIEDRPTACVDTDELLLRG